MRGDERDGYITTRGRDKGSKKRAVEGTVARIHPPQFAKAVERLCQAELGVVPVIVGDGVRAYV
jgi:hypothetical protein